MGVFLFEYIFGVTCWKNVPESTHERTHADSLLSVKCELLQFISGLNMSGSSVPSSSFHLLPPSQRDQSKQVGDGGLFKGR